MPTPLQEILAKYQTASVTQREKGTYLEELIRTYLRHEPTYADLYSHVWLLHEVPEEYGISRRDTGIDLVALTRGTGELHAIQCKFYAPGHRIMKSDIDSFFTASGQKPFTHRVIVTTTNDWSENAESALINQQPPVTRIDLLDLEASQIDWSRYKPNAAPQLKPKFDPRPHQQKAIKSVLAGLKDDDRGKLIMACGTGKTFTSLKIAEQIAGSDGRVLFLVPSLALLSQTLTEWTQQSRIPLHSFAVCSDAEVGKKRKADDDIVQTFVHELRYPATTDGKRLAEEMIKRHDSRHMSVVFSTYHSIAVIHKAQKKHGLDDFDLIICDEAHRTTGATFENEEESEFVKIHDAKFIKGNKRLYMTATPRIYANIAKAKAEQENIELCSMDDEGAFGAARAGVDQARRQLLADAGRAAQHHPAAGRGDPIDRLAHAVDRGRGADQLHVGPGLQAKLGVLAPQPRGLERAGDGDQQAVGLEGLLEEVVGALLDGGDRGLDRAVAAEDDDREIGVVAVQDVEDLEAVEAAALEPDVEQHQGGRATRDGLEGDVGIGGLTRAVALVLEDRADHVADRGLVVDDQDVLAH